MEPDSWYVREVLWRRCLQNRGITIFLCEEISNGSGNIELGGLSRKVLFRTQSDIKKIVVIHVRKWSGFDWAFQLISSFYNACFLARMVPEGQGNH